MAIDCGIYSNWEDMRGNYADLCSHAATPCSVGSVHSLPTNHARPFHPGSHAPNASTSTKVNNANTAPFMVMVNYVKMLQCLSSSSSKSSSSKGSDTFTTRSFAAVFNLCIVCLLEHLQEMLSFEDHTPPTLDLSHSKSLPAWTRFNILSSTNIFGDRKSQIRIKQTL